MHSKNNRDSVTEVFRHAVFLRVISVFYLFTSSYDGFLSYFLAALIDSYD